MLATVKKLVGIDRGRDGGGAAGVPTLDRESLEKPVTAAQDALDAANRQHESDRAKVAAVGEQIAAAERAFDDAGDDEQASRILELRKERERLELFSQRSQRAAVTAAGVVETATAARNAAILAHLEDRANGAAGRLEQLWKQQGVPTLQQLAAFVGDAETVINDARAAVSEIHRLKKTDAHPQQMSINALHNVLATWAQASVEPRVWVSLEKLFR